MNFPIFTKFTLYDHSKTTITSTSTNYNNQLNSHIRQPKQMIKIFKSLLKHVTTLSDTSLLIIVVILYGLKYLGVIGAVELYSIVSLFVVLDIRKMIKENLKNDTHEG